MNSLHAVRRGLVAARNKVLGIRQLEQRISDLGQRLEGISGPSRFCPVCGATAGEFGPGPSGRPDAACRNCGSLERHRLIWLYLHLETDLLRTPQKVLHLAPERCFMGRLKALDHLDYVTADLESPVVDVKADLQALPFEDNTFDFILCTHVLEHIPDDGKAMHELRRVLTDRGTCFINVPLSGQPTTDEDPTVTSPEERTLRFGQHDHVRYYGDDIIDRLRGTGFQVDAVHYAGRWPASMREHMRIVEDTFFIARR